MSRINTFSKTTNSVKSISISKLKEWGYLIGNKSGTINWSVNNIQTSSISIDTFNNEPNSYIELDYNWNNQRINYKIFIVEVNSNLGKGKVKYFICPKTQKKCRILFFNNGYFYHRTAFRNLFYENQIESKKNRELIKIFEKIFIPKSILEARYKKYFKTHYKGIPTKKYLKLQSKIDLANSYPVDSLENLMLK